MIKIYGIKYTKEEIKNYTKNIEKLHLKHHKPERFRQVIYIKKCQDIEDGIYLPYLISSYGRIFSTCYHMQKNVVKELSPAMNKDGYLHLILYHKGKKYQARIHRLVCTAFKKNNDYKNKYEVNHKNNKRNKNYTWNLEWCTPKYNVNYSIKKGNRITKYGEDSNRSKYTNKVIHDVCKMLEEGISCVEISRYTSVSYDTVYNVLTKRQWNIISDRYDFSKRKIKKRK